MYLVRLFKLGWGSEEGLGYSECLATLALLVYCWCWSVGKVLWDAGGGFRVRGGGERFGVMRSMA